MMDEVRRGVIAKLIEKAAQDRWVGGVPHYTTEQDAFAKEKNTAVWIVAAADLIQKLVLEPVERETVNTLGDFGAFGDGSVFELADGRLMVYTEGRYLSPGYVTQWSPLVAWLPAKVLVAK